MPLIHTPDHLVRTQQRRRRHTALVWALAFSVIAIALAGMEHLGWFKSGILAGLACATVASVLVIRWIVSARRIDTGAVARDLDTQWSLKARLEAAAELSGNSSALAAAQRADAAEKLAGHRPPPSTAWHAGRFILIAALLLVLAESGIFSFRILFKPPVPPPPPADISASIEWRSPESELKATAIEEIPLVAAAVSHTGFHAMSLEVSVNGEPRLSRPLDSATLAELAKPGPHPVKLSLYLDETGAVEFDMVSYYIRADRATNPPSPAITSPLQFVQIRPAREDVERLRGGSGKPDKLGQLSAMIGALKATQLTLLKQNFLLAHAQISKTDKAWTEANAAVASDQKTLASKVGEARVFAIAEQLPTLVVDNLTQITPLMEEAAKQIGETRNEPAARPQGHVLGLLTEIEKLIRKIIMEGGGGGPPPPNNPDPFKDEQRYKLPPRKDTPAGQLEQLAKDQSEQADKTEPSSPASSGSDSKSPSAADQAELARRAAELAKNQQLAPEAQKAVAQAARDAADAAAQLKQGDVSAARAPAQAAAQTLHEAAAAQEKAGRDAARAQLEAVRHALDEAAREPDDAARAAKLDTIAADLQASARAQQESGSAEAARQLQTVATEAAKAADAARKGTDAPAGDDPGKKSGDQPGDTPSTNPDAKPDNSPAADPNGDHQMPITTPGPGQGSGSKPGSGQDAAQQQGQAPGSGSGSEPGPGSGPGTSPRLTAVDRAGQTAATAQAALTDRTDTINRAARQLERGSGSGAAAGQGPGIATVAINTRDTDLILGAQLAHAVLATPESAKLANTIVSQLRQKSPSANVVVSADLVAAADRLRLLLAAALSDDRRDETVRRFNPEDIDPAYREAVEAYFERLSREARKPGRPPSSLFHGASADRSPASPLR